MDKEILAVVFGVMGVLWAVITSLTAKYANRQESDVDSLTKKTEELYRMIIQTQEKNTESANRLSIAVDRLTNAVSHMEMQASERHDGLSKRIDELHESGELIRLRIHWIMNKMTVIKFALEAVSGKNIGGEWNSP